MPAPHGESSGKTQKARILRAMRGGWVDPMFALKFFGCFRLGARIYDLKRDGHRIETRRVTRKGKSWCEYRLERSRCK